MQQVTKYLYDLALFLKDFIHLYSAGVKFSKRKRLYKYATFNLLHWAGNQGSERTIDRPSMTNMNDKFVVF